MNQYEKIQKRTGQNENACSCEKCRNMCRKQPCLGTPADIEKLINAGYGDKLARTLWLVGVAHGVCGPIKMVQINKTENGCPFFTADEKCALHDLGLKPTEGKLASCKPEHLVHLKDSLPMAVARTWVPLQNTLP